VQRFSLPMAGGGMVTGAHSASSPGNPLGDSSVVLDTLFAALYVPGLSSRWVTQIVTLALAAIQQTVGLLVALAFLLIWCQSARSSLSLPALMLKL
jgi:hypothetical protein